jgi:NAD(P)-dependent dehydrogenase (short-subunit alcohol dehydrogenase family)
MDLGVAVITGAFGALGRELAKAAAERGWRLALIDAAPAPPAPTDALTIPSCNLSDAAAAERAIAQVSHELGGVAALFNVAGTFRWTKVADSRPQDWELLFRVNLTTAVNASRAALPALTASGRGRIVNVGALASERAGAGMGPYAASKAGVAKLTESLAEELKGSRVTVNAVLPSIIDTPANRADMPKADFTTWVQPRELAEAMLFLASPEASAVTGALVRVPGRV